MAKRKKDQPIESHTEPHQIVEQVADSFSLPSDVPLAEPVEHHEHAHHTPHHEAHQEDPHSVVNEPAVAEEKKAGTWVDRANPWPSLSHHWPDGYKVTLSEGSWTKENQKPSAMLITFGSGTKDDQPKAFDSIKHVLKDSGYHWDAESKAWSKWLKAGQTQEGRVSNSRTRDDAIKLVDQVVRMEEAVRGEIPGRSQQLAKDETIPF
ncbi:hypothetical protein [Zavarzinella formosa]|uniref:hypothetical protein n=1 Tax=Zavarzinella formosa TaxID=360055 RepID=UPI000307CE4E|nr:hypothetical protein [Zavarzinella formosa]